MRKSCKCSKCHVVPEITLVAQGESVRIPRGKGDVGEAIERHFRKANEYARAYYTGHRFEAWGNLPAGEMFSVYPAAADWRTVELTVVA